VSLTNIFSKVTSCFFCYTEIEKKKAFTAEVETSEGQLKIKMCESCGGDFDELLKSIEEVKNV